MDIKNVMVPTDFSEPSKVALDYGVALARVLRARLTVLHVLEPEPILEVATDADVATIERQRHADALERLGTLLAPEDEDDLNLRVVLKTGNARKEIAVAVEEQGPDLVILGTHGRRRLGRLFVGSTTEALLRKLPVPVMTVSHVGSPRPFKRILFATDLSESSHASFAAASSLAQTLHAEVLAMHALGGPVLASGELGLPVQADLLAAEARRRLESLVAEGRRHGVAVQTLIADGLPTEQILNAAAENSADLILLTIERKGFVERALLGTTAEQVVRAATIPVLSIPVQIEAHKESERVLLGTDGKEARYSDESWCPSI